MDYEKKYNEALERAKKLLLGNEHSNTIRSYFEHIFPELHESEDERIRKWIIEELEITREAMSGKNPYSDDPDIVARLKRLDEAIAYLEKQKDQNWNKKPCLTCREYEKGHKQGYTEGCTAGYNKAMNEMEQKEPENTSASTMIPSCWAKDLDKCPEFCVKSHCLGCPIYEQKEQKPVEWSEEDERHRKWILEYLYDGLQKADEQFKYHFKSAIDWFEKQKEQKPEHFELKAGKWYICHRAFCCRADHLTVKEGERFMCEKDGVVKGFVIKDPEKYFIECSAPAPTEETQKEKKPVVTHRETYHVDTLGTQQVIAGKMPQKPAKLNDDTEVGLDRALQIVRGARGTLRGYQSDDGIYECDHAIQTLERILKSGIEQQPAEWSEEQLLIIDYLIDLIDEYHKEPCTKGLLANGAQCFLRNLKSLRPQPEPSWSEEDEKMLECIINVLDRLGFEEFRKSSRDQDIEEDRFYYKEIQWLRNRLKSLRPQSHKEIYQAAKHDLAFRFMNYLDENRPEGKMSLSNIECENIVEAFKENDWAKIIRYVEKYQPHWKPSEDEERLIKTSISFLNDFADMGYENAVECIDWLKSKLNGNSC